MRNTTNIVPAINNKSAVCIREKSVGFLRCVIATLK